MKHMKNINIAVLIGVVVLLSAACVADSYPKPTDAFYVNDYADVLDSRAEDHIRAIAEELEDVTTAQVVVVTMKGIGNNSLEEYTLELFRQWGIGQKDKNNGVLIFLDVEGRRSRIEVGYGLEGALTDGKTGRIQDEYMIPYFRQGQYSRGIVAGFDVIVNEIYAEYGYTDKLVGDGGLIGDQILSMDQPGDNNVPTPLVIIGIVFIVVLIFLDFMFFRGAITFMILRSMMGGGGRGPFDQGRRGGGGFGGGSFGGGSFGGGGSAGGGGSSRRW